MSKILTRLLVVAASLFFWVACQCNAAAVEALRAEELLILEGDQTGKEIRVAPDYLPASAKYATAIYAKGKPKFILPTGLRVQNDGEGWWTIYRNREPRVFEWTGEGKNDKWENPENWVTGNGERGRGMNTLVPSRIDTIKLTKETTIDMERDRMVSNIIFTAKVILAGGAVHAQNTLGRGAKGKLGVRAWSCLGRVSLKDGAIVAPLRGIAGYQGVLEVDSNNVTRVMQTRPSAVYTWSGVAKDGKWTNVKNWLVKGRVPVESPCKLDQVMFDSKVNKGNKDEIIIELPSGQTVVSNLVMATQVVWKSGKSEDVLGSEAKPSLDICDLSGNESFIARGKDVTICIRGATDVPITVEKGIMLALSAHDHKPYKSITLEEGVGFTPYDWVVEIDRLVLKGDNTMHFWPPRKFNRWRPVWVVHAKHLSGEPKIRTDDMDHWTHNVEKWNDGSSMITINYK